jgi:PTH1 family peptidyl-tRNA hydrolase
MDYLVVGLGNPGRKYSKTKHNTGFIILDELVSQKGLSWKKEKKFKAEICVSNQIIFLKPLTFMNLSGESVSKAANFYKINPNHTFVIHDDVDFPLYEWKLQYDKESAGHKGVGNIIKHLGTKSFWRLRFGVGRPVEEDFDVERYVLSKFSNKECKNIKNECAEILETINSEFLQ